MSKPKRKIKYLPLKDSKNNSNYEMILRDLCFRHKNFNVARTSYSKKITTETDVYMLNEDGKQDKRRLTIINMVRNDAKDWIKSEPLRLQNGKKHDITWTKMFDIPPKGIMSKIDIRAAYWTVAMMTGMVKKETDDLVNQMYENDDYDTRKKVRTAALGSLATHKIKEYYEAGVLNPDKTEILDYPHYQLFMDISETVDKLVLEASYLFDAVYMYWDELITDPSKDKQVRDFFRDNKFECKIDHTSLKYIPIGNHGYLLKEFNGKQTIVRKEDRMLLGI